MKNRFLKYAVIISILGFSQENQARHSGGVLIYGPEWTFSSPALLIGSKLELEDKHRQALQQLAQACRAVAGCSSNMAEARFKFQTGVSLKIGMDPGVIEVQADPMSKIEWERNSTLIQTFLFDGLAKMDLRPQAREGAGHVNIGLTYFSKKRILLRNFVADFYNHPGVGTVLNSLTANKEDAPYPADLVNGRFMTSEPQLQAYKRSILAVAELDQADKSNFSDYAKALNEFMNYKYVALGLRDIRNSLSESSRLEIRTLRPQQNMRDFMDVIEIFEARINYLESSFSGPVEFMVRPVVNDGWAALGEFADYLEETGRNWKDFRNLMPEMWRNLDERNFVRGKTRPQVMKSANRCARLFSTP